MAWRPHEQLIEGVLDNTVPNKVTGWMRFAGLKDKVMLNLQGNFHRDIRGARVRLRGEGESANQPESVSYMEGFSLLQEGSVGDMTAGHQPADYVNYPYYAQLNVMCSSNTKCFFYINLAVLNST